ncbi:MAG: acetyl-CoA carboxylase biotin carboxylase subunit [Candidatus Stahlbacteria bacterium]|nr:acetyl-CoA carboxylase biotin carboxylase subunit [Candidatus Stahlbacteria bacterium]
MIKKVLIANRGEIAIRIMRTAKELGIKSVAVYSDADRKSLHLQFADELIWIGESAALTSYLNIAKLIEVAKNAGCDAIHPGYGFLAENTEFDRRCEEAGIIFVGPNSKALALVGDKVASRETVRKVSGPIIPGMHKIGGKIEEFKEMASRVGYPVIIKASMGGGGKGMRVVKDDKELESAVIISRREAKSAFGDESVYLEKYIENPRHIEFQVLADNYGNVVHLFERECSIQRRHQKIIEETPSAALTPEIREEMGEVAKNIIKACGYTNAGTVEFLLDKDKNFYFMEVNARIQVEHPVTELTTGIDLVRQQFLIAAGEKLGFKQEEVQQQGHAIEARIYAEDPGNNFLPSPGKILFVNEPQGPGIRVDSGIYSDWEVPTFYDPILSKLIVWGETREVARKRIIGALKKYAILGIRTSIDYLIAIMEHPKFIDAELSTNFISANMSDWKPNMAKLDIALIAASLSRDKHTPQTVVNGGPQTTPWQEIGKWEICGYGK